MGLADTIVALYAACAHHGGIPPTHIYANEATIAGWAREAQGAAREVRATTLMGIPVIVDEFASLPRFAWKAEL